MASSNSLGAHDDDITTLTSPTAIVHLEYDVSNPPDIPSSAWTRFVCISDTHSRTLRVPDGDVLIHSGDLTSAGTYADFHRTMDWLADLPHPKKMCAPVILNAAFRRASSRIIAGNHDLPLDMHNDWYANNFHRWHSTEKQNIGLIQDLVQGHKSTRAGIVYLEDDRYEFRAKENGRIWSVYGSPWSPWFHNWAFNYERGEEAKNLVAAFPKSDILVTHGPPFEILDMTVTREHVGCEELRARLSCLRPRLHVFGHIHEDHGAVMREWTDVEGHEGEQTVFVNAANWPMGPKVRRSSGGRILFGEAPFQPVIVDLLDEA
ncbi:Metallo-dependent phosphatase-like protein [Amylocystis lapponica]|nr:Metallo-dependent phosphatase-like protein [Amylocystis lapponica]